MKWLKTEKKVTYDVQLTQEELTDLIVALALTRQTNSQTADERRRYYVLWEAFRDVKANTL